MSISKMVIEEGKDSSGEQNPTRPRALKFDIVVYLAGKVRKGKACRDAYGPCEKGDLDSVRYVEGMMWKRRACRWTGC